MRGGTRREFARMRGLLLLSALALLAAALLPTATLALQNDGGAALQPVSLVETESSGSCPSEALKRIALCQKILGTFVQGDTSPQGGWTVPHARSFSAPAVCREVVRSYPSYVNQANCEKVASHVYFAAGGSVNALVTLFRQRDIQDTCAHLLAKPYPANSQQRFIQAADEAKCTLAATKGITGLRALMFHGTGMSRLSYRAGGATGSRPWDGFLGSLRRYWRNEVDLNGYADVRFYVTDTNRRWDDAGLQREYCAAITRYNPHVIFTHSMGNLIIAAGIKNRVAGCTNIGKTGSQIRWFSSQAPWIGSPCATSAVRACNNEPATVMAKLRNMAVQAGSPCPQPQSTHSLQLAYRSSGSLQLAGMKEIARNHVSGALCGLTGNPLAARQAFSLNGAGLWALSNLGQAVGMVEWGRDAATKTTSPFTGNDGLVPFASCDLGGSVRYTASSSAAFYAGLISHQDGTCFIGDLANAPVTKRPCQWFVNRAAVVRGELRLPNPTKRVAEVGPVTNAGSYLPFARYSYPRSFLQLEQAPVPVQRLPAPAASPAMVEQGASAEEEVMLLEAEPSAELLLSLEADAGADMPAALEAPAPAADAAALSAAEGDIAAVEAGADLSAEAVRVASEARMLLSELELADFSDQHELARLDREVDALISLS